MPNPTRSDLFTALHNSAKSLCNEAKGIGKVTQISISAGATAFISSNATFNLLGTVFAGYPTIAPEILKELAKYQIPAVAIVVAFIKTLKNLNIDYMETLNRLVISLTGAVGMTSFFVPLTMELITRIIQLIEKEPRSSSVYISNEAAAAIIGGCMLTGLLQGMQTYFLDIKATYPNQPLGCLSQTMTHPGLRATLGSIDTASATHSLIMAIEKIAGINTETNTAYYTRSGFTLVMGIIGAIVQGFGKKGTNEEDNDKPNGVDVFMIIMKTMQFVSLLLACYGTFIKSPAAESVFGEEVIDEQLWLWLLVIPIVISLPIAASSCFTLVTSLIKNTDLEEEQSLINNFNDLDVNGEDEGFSASPV